MAKILKQLREDKGIPKIKVAEKLHIHRETYDKIENGRASLKAEHIITLSKLFGISTNKLLKVYTKEHRDEQN